MEFYLENWLVYILFQDETEVEWDMNEESQRMNPMSSLSIYNAADHAWNIHHWAKMSEGKHSRENEHQVTIFHKKLRIVKSIWKENGKYAFWFTY